ncbi:hypothetical protein MP228_004394 [Amoeboaphelidium protococcarum]|nr:hypothetical protein MP228_004394 [Amoeboaphelidium protococcarum]
MPRTSRRAQARARNAPYQRTYVVTRRNIRDHLITQGIEQIDRNALEVTFRQHREGEYTGVLATYNTQRQRLQDFLAECRNPDRISQRMRQRYLLNQMTQEQVDQLKARNDQNN